VSYSRDPSEPARSLDGAEPEREGGDVLAGDALPVPVVREPIASARARAGATPEARQLGVAIPAVQAAAVAAGSFVAGAAVVGLVHRRQRRSSALARGARGRRRIGKGASARRGTGRAAELVQIVSSRSLLVDVHLLGSPGER
jgi:hypothetical protein